MSVAKSGKYVLSRSPSNPVGGPTCWNNMGNFLAMAFASIVVPSGYSNDYKMHHPRIKGGLYLILNYILNMTILGVSLGYTILHRVPNDIHGIQISNPSINVNIPSSSITVETGGMDVSINLPQNKINLASMPSMDASMNTDSSDRIHAIIFPVVLAAFCLPFTIMRAAMMELDCFVTRRKQLGDDFDEFLVLESSPKKKEVFAQNRRKASNWTSLRDGLARNAVSKELKCRLYMAIMCSGFGMMVMTTFMMLMGALFYMAL